MPRVIQFRKKEGVLHVPVTDIAGVLKQADGSGVVSFKNGMEPITVKRADAIIDAMAEPTAPAPKHEVTSLFEQIFGGKW